MTEAADWCSRSDAENGKEWCVHAAIQPVKLDHKGGVLWRWEWDGPGHLPRAVFNAVADRGKVYTSSEAEAYAAVGAVLREWFELLNL